MINVELLPSSEGAPLSVDTDTLESLRSVATRTDNTLTELQQFIDDKLIKKGKIVSGEDEEPNVSKRAWFKHDTKIQSFKERLRDCRVGITTHLTMISTRMSMTSGRRM